jgi:molybdopterin converting factor small subunit
VWENIYLTIVIKKYIKYNVKWFRFYEGLEVNINLLCYATLADKCPKNADKFPISQDSKVEDVLNQIGIDTDDVKIIFINGISSGLDSVLSDGDRLGIFPAVGGG